MPTQLSHGQNCDLMLPEASLSGRMFSWEATTILIKKSKNANTLRNVLRVTPVAVPFNMMYTSLKTLALCRWYLNTAWSKRAFHLGKAGTAELQDLI